MIHCIIRKLSIYTNKDEFVQIGLIALWEAHRRFNPQKGLFSNYAYTYIKGSMMQELTKRKKDEEHTFYADGEFFEVFLDPGDLISVPENVRHYFTLQDDRQVVAVRIFVTTEGWVPIYENEKVSQ